MCWLVDQVPDLEEFNNSPSSLPHCRVGRCVGPPEGGFFRLCCPLVLLEAVLVCKGLPGRWVRPLDPIRTGARASAGWRAGGTWGAHRQASTRCTVSPFLTQSEASRLLPWSSRETVVLGLARTCSLARGSFWVCGQEMGRGKPLREVVT